MGHGLPTPALKGLGSGIPHWLAGGFSERCCGLKLFLQSFHGHRLQSCLLLLSFPTPPPSAFILPRGKKCDVREITIWPQKTRKELLLCYFLALWTSTPPAHLRNVSTLLCVPERIAERTCEKTNCYHSRHDPCLTPRLKSLHIFLSLGMSIAFRWEVRVLF